MSPTRTRRHGSDFGPQLVQGPGPDDRDGGPELVQLLTPEGERVEHPDFSFGTALDDEEAEKIRGFYRDMVLTRRIDVEATALQRHGELGIWAQLLGQEAAQIGSGRALRTQDFVFPTYREHGVAWCRGVDPLKLLGLFRGVDQGSWDPNENNFGLYTIVIGAQTLHATGYAMGVQRDGHVGTGDPDRDAAVVAYFGDGASSQGDVNEAFIFAASYNAPVVFFCQNNQWAISEPIERQSRIPLYQRALGFGFPGVRVDGNDVLATYAVTQAALQRARDGQGPTFVEAYTYRMGAHTTTDDPTRYRLSADLEHWKLKDPIQRVKVYLTRNGLVDQAFLDDVDAEAEQLGEHAARGLPGDGRPAHPRRLRPGLRRADRRARGAEGRLRRLPRHLRGAVAVEPASRRRTMSTKMTLAKALNAGLRRAMEDDPKVLVMGEDVGKLGGVFRITDGLQKDFGEDRVIDSPLAESGILGTAVGLAMRGYRPVCEIQFDGFVYPAYDQIVSQVAKLHFRSQGKVKMPMVIRIPFGGGIGAVEHHSESPEAQFAHTPGLKVVACSNPVDGYWMIQQAIAHDDPVVFLEPKRQYHADKAEIDETATPDPLFTSRIVRAGDDVTLLSYGPMVKVCLASAEAAVDRGHEHRGHRPAHAVAARHGAGARLGAPDRPRGRRPRGARQPRHGRRAGRPHHRGVLLLPRGAGAPGRRLRHPLPAGAGRGGVAARPRPGAGRRRPIAALLTG